MAAQQTTAELIEAIAQCKSDILAAIQSKGGEIDESTPFTEYAYAIQNLPTCSIDYTYCRIAIFDYDDRSNEVSTIANNKQYWVELRDRDDIPMSEPLGGHFDCRAENSQNFSFYADDDHEGGADCTLQIDGAEDGDTITLVYVDANGEDAVELQLTASASASEGQYRIEIYDEMGKDNGQQVEPDQLRRSTRYSVYLFDIVNVEYKEDLSDWELTTDDDWTLISDIGDGDSQAIPLSSCVSIATDGVEGETTLFAVNPLDHSDVYADLPITVIDA